MIEKVELWRSERLKRDLTPPSKICQPNCVGPEYNSYSNKISLYFPGKVIRALYLLGGFPGIAIPIEIIWQILPCADKV